MLAFINPIVAMASSRVSVGKLLKHIVSTAIPAEARFLTAVFMVSTLTPLLISFKIRGDADSIPRAMDNAPPSLRSLHTLSVRAFSGLMSDDHVISRLLFFIDLASSYAVFGRNASWEK